MKKMSVFPLQCCYSLNKKVITLMFSNPLTVLCSLNFQNELLYKSFDEPELVTYVS